MSSSFTPTTWRVADVSFVEIEIRHFNSSDRQLRVKLEGGVRIVIIDACQVPLAAALIVTLRAGRRESL